MDLTLVESLKQSSDSIQLGRLAEGKKLLAGVLAFDPDNPEANYQMGLVEKGFFKPEKAKIYFEKSLQVNPLKVEIWLSYIDTLAELNQFGFAKRVIKQLRNKGAKGVKLDIIEERINQQSQKLEPSKSLETGDDQVSIAQEPSDSELSSLANSFENKKFQDLLDYAHSILDRYPNSIKLHGFLVATNLILGKYKEVIQNCEKIHKINPNLAQNYRNMGFAFYNLGELRMALKNYQQAIRIDPNISEVHYNTGLVLLEQGQLELALVSLFRALDIKPEFLEAYNNIAIIQQQMGKIDDAMSNYKKALSFNPNYINSIVGLGKIYAHMGKYNEALSQFRKSHKIIRGDNSEICSHKSYDAISKAKIDHDIEQFEYLSTLGYQANRFKELATDYKKISTQIQWPSDVALVRLTPEHKRFLRDTYNRPVHVIEAPRLSKSPLQDSIKSSNVIDDYFANGQGLTYIDNFLTTKALQSLRQFLLCSTIWYDLFHDGGYLGAYLDDGLACPLLLQISYALREKFPEIFKNHALSQLWAYKYDSKAYKEENLHKGIAAHADSAAINVNFWITPQEANIDDSSGGLVVYNDAAPLDWGFKKFNSDKESLKKYLEKHQSARTIIPYKENRAVVFNSNLIHETDKFNFKEGYQNRRINITMLFGERH